MVAAIDIRELPARLDEALALASADGEIILLDGSTPRARLLPLGPSPLRVAGLHPGALQPAPDFDAPLPDDFWPGRHEAVVGYPRLHLVWDSDPAQLSAAALAALRDPTNEVWLRVASVWEMVIKAQLGKLTLRLPLADIVSQQQANGLRVLPVTLPHVLAVEGLPPIHKDPFDRVLVAQSNVKGAELVFADHTVRQYPVRVLW